MSYVAKHYTEIAGCKFTPGEVISKPIDPEKLPRLLRLGAIKKVAGYEPEPDPDEEKRDTENPSSFPEESEAQDSSSDAEEDDDTDAPVVDVMDGIVAPEAAEKAPARKTTGKKVKKA